MTHTQRQTYIKNSNNKQNPRQNLCALEIAKQFSIPNDTDYLHTLHDIKNHIQKTHTLTVSKQFDHFRPKLFKREFLKYTLNHQNILGYVIHINGHIALINPSGNTIIDTAANHTKNNKINYTLIIYNN